MTPTSISLSTAQRGPRGPRAPMAGGRGCPLGSNCSCVFQRVQAASDDADATATVSPNTNPNTLPNDPLAAEVTNLTDWGWNVVRTEPTDVHLERQRSLPFCANLALCLVTAGLWLIYWVPRTRHPRVDTVTVSRAPDGTASVSPVTKRQRTT
ncbi:MAG: hypothetical protein JWP75_3213 [Frondihabitans sp.]|nr:hypothetical protein [Frondihabitans sp.]